MANQKSTQIVRTYKGKVDLIIGIIGFVIGILIAKTAGTYAMYSFSYDETAANSTWFGICLIIFGIICMLHYAIKKPTAVYSDGTTATLNKIQKAK